MLFCLGPGRVSDPAYERERIVGGSMNKTIKNIIITLLIVLGVAGTAAGIYAYLDYDKHKYDQDLASPETAIEKCLINMTAEGNQFVTDTNLYTYLSKQRKEAGPQSQRIADRYNQNLILEQVGSIDSFSEIVKITAWQLRYCEFSEPEKIIQDFDDEVLYRIKASEEDYNQELWIRFNQAANGLWYISEFTNRPPYDWDGNSPLTEKNKEYAKQLIENITDDEIRTMAVWASAAGPSGDPEQSGFLSPSQLGWESYLNFMFGSLSEEELAAAYDAEAGCYRFTEAQIGSYIWTHLGDDEYENNALDSYGYPHGSHIAKEYIVTEEDGKYYTFTQEMVHAVKTFHPDCMVVTNREVLDNGRAVFEISYNNTDEATAPETTVVNYQRLEVRAMESGCRYLSYTVIQPEQKLAGNRMIEQFIDKSWNMVSLYHFTYPEGSEDPETQSLRIIKDFSALRESLRQFKAGEAIDIDALPEDARIMNAWLMEAENGRERRMLELYNLKAGDHDYLLLRSYYLTLTAGNSGGSMSVSINNTQITQNGYGEEYMLCYFDDHQMFQDIIMKVLDSEQ